MPIAIPPPDIDPTVMPPVSTHPTEAEAMENGMAPADETAGGGMPLNSDSVAAASTTLWVDWNPRLR